MLRYPTHPAKQKSQHQVALLSRRRESYTGRQGDWGIIKVPSGAKCLWVQVLRQKKPQISLVLLGTHWQMTVKKSFTLPYSPLVMDQCPSSSRCESFNSNSGFINEKAMGWGWGRELPFFSIRFMSISFSTLLGSFSHSCIRTKGSRPFRLSLCQGLGRARRSETEPWVSPRMVSPNKRWPGERTEPGEVSLLRLRKLAGQVGVRVKSKTGVRDPESYQFRV